MINCPCSNKETVCCKCGELLCFSYENFCIKVIHIIDDKRTWCTSCYAAVRSKSDNSYPFPKNDHIMCDVGQG